MVVIEGQLALGGNEHRSNVWPSCEPSMQRAGKIVAGNVSGSDPTSKAVKESSLPLESPSCQDCEANGAGKRLDAEQSNDWKEEGRFLCAHRCTRLQGCGECRPQSKEHILPAHYLPDALYLKYDSVIKDTDVKPDSDLIEVSDMNNLGGHTAGNDSSERTAKSSSDRLPEGETRVKQRFRFAAVHEQTHMDTAASPSHTDTQATVTAEQALHRDFKFLSLSDGRVIPLRTLPDTGTVCSLARRSFVTRGFAKLQGQATPVTLRAAWGGTVTTNEFTWLELRCSRFEDGKTVMVKFFLLDDEYLLDYDAYLCKSDSEKTGCVIIP
ncbi:hypothetical protein PV11_03116 [Exophiala sideris]|uniref:Uncharacterized protein n=1 Tax=Exophiala sideris TaxID=1016849 RepID=A0A0D1YYC0_9EURO|nr:hypothetical protein PV11_03116 [Exophiala sideris]